MVTRLKTFYLCLAVVRRRYTSRPSGAGASPTRVRLSQFCDDITACLLRLLKTKAQKKLSGFPCLMRCYLPGTMLTG